MAMSTFDRLNSRLEQFKEHTNLTNSQLYVSIFGILGFLLIALILPFANELLSQQYTPSASTAYPFIIYVNKDSACPGTGSSSSPFCTIQAALSAATPGTDIRVRKASSPYDEQVTAIVSGTADSPITIEADDPANQPILRYTGNGVHNGMLRIGDYDHLGPRYWTIQNLIFDGTGTYTSTMAIWVQGPDWTKGPDQAGIQILNNTFKNWGRDAGIMSNGYYGGSAVNISGGWAPPLGAYLPNGTIIRGNVFDGNRNVALSMQSTKNSMVETNEFTNLTCGTANDGAGGTAVITNGIHIVSGTSGVGSGDIYRHNTFHDYQSPSQCPYTQSSGAYTEMEALHCDVSPSNGVVDSNSIWNLDPTNSLSQAIAIHIEYDCHGWTVENNIIHDVGVEGIRHNPTTAGAVDQYLNNMIYNTKWYSMSLWSGNAVVQNTIFANAEVAQMHVDYNAIAQANLTLDHNDYWDNAGGAKVGQWNGTTLDFASWKTACNCDSHSLNADPKCISTTDFHLQSSSTATPTPIATAGCSTATPARGEALAQPIRGGQQHGGIGVKAE